MSQQAKVVEFTISEENKESFKRLDQFLAHNLEDQSRSVIKDLFSKGNIISKEKIELKKMPNIGTKVIVTIPPPRPADAQAEDIPLNIVYEDEHLIFVNKVAGMVVHPAPGNYTGTLVNAILHHCPDLKGIGDQKRPGIVHRLDKGTSGVMVVAKDQKTHEGLVKHFSTHNIERVYEALAVGTNFNESGTLQSTIGRHPQNRLKMAVDVRNGKDAITYYNVLKHFHKFAHLRVKLETGRTHQIRVHLSQLLKKAILCDPLYGNPKEHIQRLGPNYKSIIENYEYPFLHARVLGFTHPITGEELVFEVEPPKTFKEVLAKAYEVEGGHDER